MNDPEMYSEDEAGHRLTTSHVASVGGYVFCRPIAALVRAWLAFLRNEPKSKNKSRDCKELQNERMQILRNEPK